MAEGFDDGATLVGAFPVAPHAASEIAAIGTRTALTLGRLRLKLYFLADFMTLLRNHLNDGMKSLRFFLQRS